MSIYIYVYITHTHLNAKMISSKHRGTNTSYVALKAASRHSGTKTLDPPSIFNASSLRSVSTPVLVSRPRCRMMSVYVSRFYSSETQQFAQDQEYHQVTKLISSSFTVTHMDHIEYRASNRQNSNCSFWVASRHVAE